METKDLADKNDPKPERTKCVTIRPIHGGAEWTDNMPDDPTGGYDVWWREPIYVKKSFADDDGPFISSILAARVGFPLKFTPNLTSDYVGFNWAANMIFMDFEPDSPDFGHSSINPTFKQEMVVVRVDGHDVDNAQYDAFFDFVTSRLMCHILPLREMNEGQAKEEYRHHFRRMITPEALHTHFQEYRRHQVRNGRPNFLKAKSPVMVTHETVEPACGTCLLTGAPEKPLLRCAKCKARYYCNHECQKLEWKKHKKVCGMV